MPTDPTTPKRLPPRPSKRANTCSTCTPFKTRRVSIHFTPPPPPNFPKPQSVQPLTTYRTRVLIPEGTIPLPPALNIQNNQRSTTMKGILAWAIGIPIPIIIILYFADVF